ncbi:MAG: preprotein translocase subunit YajC [Alphaproteobacteria bacterium]|nr:preprotein translocase subunit YajC [Alphaproteobacteria bacterium]
MLITPAYAQAASGGNALFELLFPLLMVFAIIYFMILRPQQKRQREHEALVNGVSRGDTVITQGGLVGKVAKVGDDELEVDFADNARIKVVKSMIISVRGKNTD